MEKLNRNLFKKRGIDLQRVTNELTAFTSKKPPQAIEIEEAVLGAIMCDKEAFNLVADLLRPESFYKDNHQLIYKAMIELSALNEPIDILTVTNQLRKNGELEMVGGAAYLMNLTNTIHTAAHVEYHARIIMQHAIKRDLIRMSANIQREAFEDSTDVFELLEESEKSLFKISEVNITRSYNSMGTLVSQAIEEMQKRSQMPAGLTGVPSGFTHLDRLTSGFQPSTFNIVAARPGVGKTVFALTVARNAAVDFGKSVAIFSLEMSALEVTNRLISSEAELNSDKIKSGKLTPTEWQQLESRLDRLSKANIFIDDTPAISVLELNTKCRRLKAQNNIDMVIIDYLQLMRGDTSGNKNVNREQEIAYISRSLKQLSKELDIPVIALAQLSRDVEKRGGEQKTPQLSDLRESGSLEQDADMVMFLYRPDYYKITQDEEGNSIEGLCELIIGKHRSGGLDTIQLRFIKEQAKFTNWQDFINVPSGSFNDFSGATQNISNTSRILESKINTNSSPSVNLEPDNGEPPF